MPMRPATVRLSAAGFSSWIPLNRYSSAFGVGLGVVFSSNGNATASVQHTFDDIFERTNVNMSRSMTSLSITKTNHGLSVDSWAMISGGTIWDGQYAVASITDQNTFVVTVADTGATSGVGYIQTARVFNHSVLAGITDDADSNYSAPPRACRLIITTFVAGYVDLNVISGGK